MAWIEGIFSNRRRTAYLWEEAGQPVGSLLLAVKPSNAPASIEGDVAHLELIWVDPAYRQRGIGAKMVSIAERWTKDRDCTIIELSYMPGNGLAEKVWQKLGYQPFRVYSYKKISEK